MRNVKFLLVGLLLTSPGFATADASDIPSMSTWYLHVNLELIRTEDTTKGIYAWMSEEIFEEVKEESGVDIGEELDELTAYSVQGQGPVFVFEGNISQTSKDRLMTFIAVEGDLKAAESSGKQYYRLTDNGEDGAGANGGNIEIQFESLEDESWISMAFDNKVIVTSSEDQMKALLANGGKVPGKRDNGGAMLILTAEKALLQAGINSSAMDDDGGESGWESNILRNTEQVAFMIAAVANKIAIEVRLVTTEPDMAQSLASVVRGLISLVAFNDEMDAETIAMLQSTKVEADGNSLSITLAIDPEIVVATLRD